MQHSSMAPLDSALFVCGKETEPAGFWASVLSFSVFRPLGSKGQEQLSERHIRPARSKDRGGSRSQGFMSCLGRAAVPVKRVRLGLSGRLGLRRTTGRAGLGELRKEVRTCEYRDVHVMWEMLGGVDEAPPLPWLGDKSKSTARRRKRRKAAPAAAAWSRLVSYCCACAR